MRVPIATWRVSFAAVACLLFVSLVSAQEVIDRVVARIENDVILLSDVRLLSHYQLLVEGKAEGDAEILDRLIDQWIVRNEANVARTPQPSDPDIDRAVQRLIQGFSSKEDFEPLGYAGRSPLTLAGGVSEDFLPIPDRWRIGLDGEADDDSLGRQRKIEDARQTLLATQKMKMRQLDPGESRREFAPAAKNEVDAYDAKLRLIIVRIETEDCTAGGHQLSPCRTAR